MDNTINKKKIGKIKITLLSDLCTSDGSSYNSSINTDVCYDAYGFPYIPGKRIKGCLRECAIELLDWNVLTVQDVERLFGTDELNGGVRIGNAYLYDYDSMIKVIDSGNVLFHPQNIMSKYTYVREQTAINYYTGTAKGKGMLRSNRVVAKGKVFETDVEFDKDLEAHLQKCCRIFTHMGMYRTRGYGEIKAELEVTGEKECLLSDNHAILNLTDGRATITYTMILLEPVICKSVAGDAVVTMDYIEGAKILGSILGKVKQDGGDIKELLDGDEFICSNAYIGEAGKRFTEVPACYYSIKNNTDSFINELYPELKHQEDDNQKENMQLNKMKHCYVLEEITEEGVFLKQKHVELETSYHHRRPENKAIGHPISSKEDSNFFQVESISPGQEFYGFLNGTAQQLQAISKYIEGIHYIGFSKTAEFGKVSIKIDRVDMEEVSSITTNEIMVKLEAPTILYNDKAFYSINVTDLRKKVEAELGIDKENIIKADAYVNYVRIGGFQVTWKCRKPTIDAFDKGTVLHYVLKQPMQIKNTKLFLGERVQEGYGETSVHVVHTAEGVQEKNRKGSLCKKTTEHTQSLYYISKNTFAEELCKSVFEEFYKARLVDDAKIFASKNYKMFKGQESRCQLVYVIMLKLCQENDNWDAFKQMKENTFIDNQKDSEKRNRKKISDSVLKAIENNIVQLKNDFCVEYSLKWEPEISDYYLGYLEKFVYELKRITPEGEMWNAQTK